MSTFVSVIVVLAGYYLLKSLIMNDLSPEKARRLKKDGAIIIDVRSEDEYKASHLKTSINIPLNEIKNKIGSHVPDKNKDVLLHCRSGSRSFVGKRILKQMEYKNVYNLGSFRRAERLVDKV